MSSKKYNLVGFLARDHGYNALESLIKDDRLNIIQIFTHRREAKFFDEERKERPDYKNFVALCEENDIPLMSVDSTKDSDKMDELLKSLEIDMMVSVSWRRIVRPYNLALPLYPGINLHRGKLPEYAGGRPIFQALQNNEKDIVISCHILEEEIDAGEVLCEAVHPSNIDDSVSLEDNEDRLKKEITPYYGPLAIQGIDVLIEKDMQRTKSTE